MIKSKSGAQKLQDGFTLIEMVIAFALLGLVIASLYSFYSSGLLSWNRSIVRMEKQQTARIAMDKMIMELQDAHLVKCCIDPERDCSGIPLEMIYFRTDVDGRSTRHSFRLKKTQLHLDQRWTITNIIRSTNVVALGLSRVQFLISENGTVYITVEAGEGTGATRLSGAVRPRNLPVPGPDREQVENTADGENHEK